MKSKKIGQLECTKEQTLKMEEQRNGRFKSTVQTIYKTITVEPALFLFSFGYFLYYLTVQDLIYTKVCFEKFNDTNFCANNATAKEDKSNQTEASHWMMYMAVLYMIPATITTIYSGAWGDRLGRKIPLIIAPIGFAFTSIGCMLYSIYMKTLPLWILLIIAIIGGLGGGEITILAGSVTYVSSVSTREKRIFRLAILEAMLTIGGILGTFFSGIITKNIGHYAVFITSAGSAILCLLYVVLFVKNIKEEKELVNTRHLLSLAHVKESFVTCFKRRPNTDSRLYIIISFLIMAANYYFIGVVVSIEYLYLKDKPLLWSYEKYTDLEAIQHILEVLGLSIILPILQRQFGLRVTTICMIGSIAQICQCMLLGVGTDDTLIYLSVAIGCTWIFSIVATRTIISNTVEKGEEGKLFAVASILQYFVISVSVVLANLLWPVTRTLFKGLLFESACVFAILALICTIYLHLHMKESYAHLEVGDDGNERKQKRHSESN